jgi:ABC-2 type transport system ATP-binding protein/lipopolysaccharide transport system ATP-binding protein
MTYIRLRDVAVEFPIYQGGSRSLKKSIVSGMRQSNLTADGHGRVNILALNGISVDVREGERLGIIGANGAGKSTLLRVLAGIFEPTHGQFESHGRVTALLTSSVGLDMDATGRENIRMRGMYQDIHPHEMRSKVDEIADFTELDAYLDMPVRTYSSGMMVRLCFAAATSFPTDILLLDEWLSAGDARFIGKAQNFSWTNGYLPEMRDLSVKPRNEWTIS